MTLDLLQSFKQIIIIFHLHYSQEMFVSCQYVVFVVQNQHTIINERHCIFVSFNDGFLLLYGSGLLQVAVLFVFDNLQHYPVQHSYEDIFGEARVIQRKNICVYAAPVDNMRDHHDYSFPCFVREVVFDCSQEEGEDKQSVFDLANVDVQDEANVHLNCVDYKQQSYTAISFFQQYQDTDKDDGQCQVEL